MSGINYFTGQVLCSGTCPIEHIDIAGNRIKKPEAGWPDISGLNNLQASRTTWLSDSAIEAALREYHSGLAPDVRSRIDITLPLIDPAVFSRGSLGEDALVKFVNNRRRARLYRAMKSKEYSIFPVNTEGNHWVTVVLHKELRAETPGDAARDASLRGRARRSGDGDRVKKTYSRVGQIAVIDPFRDEERVNVVASRIETILTRAGGFEFAANSRRSIWCPHQPDATSCGPRSYWCAKQLMDRVQESYEVGGSFYDEDSFWDHLSGWFNEDFVRGEMIGRVAWAAVKDMDYKARLAVECVNRVRRYGDNNNNSSEWLSAAATMKPTDNHLAYEKRPAEAGKQAWDADPGPGPGPAPQLVPGVSVARAVDKDDVQPVGRLPSAMAVDNNAWELATGVAHSHSVTKKRRRDETDDAGEEPDESPSKRGPAWARVARNNDDLLSPFLPPLDPAEDYRSVVDRIYDPRGNVVHNPDEVTDDDPFGGDFSWGDTF